ncbi:MAG: class I SAM-dependent methyltransferase [Chloroflexi bacterium]|nr:class I SAM-dependent methyltransferase [Chloroflexota bacterium]
MDNRSVERKGWDWDRVQGEQRAFWTEPEGELIPFVSRIARERARRVYDLGCGIGRHTVYLARRGFEVYASDISEEAVRETRGWLGNEDLAGEVVRSDLTVIPYPDGRFDAVIAVNVVYHALREDIEACLNEVRRVLRPGGLFFVTFNSTSSDDFGRGRRVDDRTFVKVGGVEDGIPHYFADRADVERLLVGFDLLRMYHREEWLFELDSAKKGAHWIVWARKR